MTRLDGTHFYEQTNISSIDRYAIETSYPKVKIYGEPPGNLSRPTMTEMVRLI